MKATESTQTTLRQPIEILIVDSNPADTRMTKGAFRYAGGKSACAAFTMGGAE
jgi:hypothetical protein